MKQRIAQFTSSNQAQIGAAFLVLFAIAFCLPALTSPFWNDNDTWSNILPVIHYRDSIFNDRALPLHTDLWYGGRYQWQNPLWSFLYLPAAIVWLALPLDWGTRVVFFGHLIFAALAGRKLASLFLESEIERAAAAILFISPLLPAFTAGHVEKILSWGWILLAFCFLFNENLTPARKGIGAGLCLGILPLTGANYYTLYTGIVLLFLVTAYKNRTLFANFLLGSAIGLLHLPSVWYLIGQPRANAEMSIAAFKTNLPGIFSALSIGLANPMGWETWAPIGIPVVLLLLLVLYRKIKSALTSKQAGIFSPPENALLAAFLVLALLATGAAYQGHTLLNSFRVPARAVALIAVVTILFVLLSVKNPAQIIIKPKARSIILLASAIQVGIFSFAIQPDGSRHSPYDTEAQVLADVLKEDGAKSVWISMQSLSDMYIQAVLNQNGIGLPNVYFGDMGQKVSIAGEICGYSFDHLVTLAPVDGPWLELKADMEWSDARGVISLDELTLIRQVKIGDNYYNVYRLACLD